MRSLFYVQISFLSTVLGSPTEIIFIFICIIFIANFRWLILRTRKGLLVSNPLFFFFFFFPYAMPSFPFSQKSLTLLVS